MRVALLQLALNRKSRAATIQSLLAGIRLAAEAAPAPDLLVLPGACDTGGAATGRDPGEAPRQSVKETIAAQAREWGVFIAAGLHKRAVGGLRPWAVLFDPDGDVVAQDSGALRSAQAEPDAAIEIWSSAVGNLGVVEPSARTIGQGLAAARGAFLAVPARIADLTGGPASLLASTDKSLPAEDGIYWGVVVPADRNALVQGGRPVTTFLRGPEGSIIALADTAEETIVHADVQLAPVTPEGVKNVCLRGRQAD